LAARLASLAFLLNTRLDKVVMVMGHLLTIEYVDMLLHDSLLCLSHDAGPMSSIHH
jgi:hypothetical protein